MVGRWVVGFGVISLLVACSVADVPGGRGAAPNPETDGTDVLGGAGGSCEVPKPLTKDEIGKLPACACTGGSSHCASKEKIPSNITKQLEDCNEGNGACIPDTILEGKALTKCKANGEDGRCLSICIKGVGDLKDDLDRGEGQACGEDERCIPCISPTTQKPTGVCVEPKPADECIPKGSTQTTTTEVKTEGGDAVVCPFAGKPKDVTIYEQCAPGGRCVKADSLDKLVDPSKKEQLQKRLNACTVSGEAGGAGFCVPEEYIAKYGQHRPASCNSFANIEGRCMSNVLKDVAAMKDLLQQENCTANERCLPCFNPATSEPTGACSIVSCDAPQTQPPKLKECCRVNGAMQGKCVPRNDVPTQYRDRLDSHQCDEDTELCAPSEHINPDIPPVACTSGGKPGFCVSDCIEFGIIESIVLDRGTCTTGHTCVPCTSPTGKPTGAPGCK